MKNDRREEEREGGRKFKWEKERNEQGGAEGRREDRADGRRKTGRKQ